MPILVALMFTLLVTPVPAQAGGRAPVEIDAACRSAMAPYYAALLASARGDADGTLRHVVLLESRWKAVLALPADSGFWLRDTVGGQTTGAAVASKIESARRRLPRDVAGAHTELEGVRLLLRDARVRHGVRTLDDALSDYHSAMERLSGHVGESNEVSLSRDDFVVVRDDVRRARSAWTDVESFQELKAVAGSNDATTATRGLLGKIGDAAERSDATTAQEAGRQLKTRYFELLAALARRN